MIAYKKFHLFIESLNLIRSIILKKTPWQLTKQERLIHTDSVVGWLIITAAELRTLALTEAVRISIHFVSL